MDRKLTILVLLFFLVLGTFSVSLFTNYQRAQTRADNPEPPSSEESFMLGIPPNITIGNETTINVVVRDNGQHAVSGAEVCINTSLGQLNAGCAQSDDTGIAAFSLTSDTPGTAEISGNINGTTPITKTVTILISQ